MVTVTFYTKSLYNWLLEKLVLLITLECLDLLGRDFGQNKNDP